MIRLVVPASIFRIRQAALLGLACLSSLLGVISTRSQVMPYHYYTTRDGLPSNQINALYQDSRGVIWIGTSNGIAVFDGISFARYSTLDGLPNNYIMDIVESGTHPGSVYVSGSTGALCRISAGTVTRVPTDSADSRYAIQTLVADERGEVWCMTKKGVYLAQDTVLTLVIARTRSGNASNLLVVRNGRLWIASDNQLSICSRGPDDTFSRERTVQFGANILSLSGGHDGSIWLGSADSVLFQFRDSTIVHKRKLAEGLPNGIVDDGAGTLWISSRRDFFKLATGAIESDSVVLYSRENDLVDPVNGFPFFDRENDLWIGTWSRGIILVPNKNLARIFTDRDKVNMMAVADSAGHLWVASENGVWEIYPARGNQWLKFLHHFPDDEHGGMYFLYVDPDGNLWVNANARPGILDCYAITRRTNQESLLKLSRRVTPGPGPGEAHLHGMLIDRQNRLWCGVFPTGMIVRDLKTLKLLRSYTLEDGIPDNAIRFLFQDREDNVWLGGFYGGLSVKLGGQPLSAKLKKYTVADGLPDNGIRSLYQDDQNYLWIGTRYGGVTRFSNGHFQTISTKEGLQSNAIWSISEDNQKHLWLGTDVGLECVDEATGNPVRTQKDYLGNRVLSSGIYGNTFLWFATLDGVTIDDFRLDVPDTIPPPIVLRKFQVNGKDVPLNNASTLSYDQNLCTVEFAGLSYRDPQAVRYQYKLEDIEDNWAPPTRQHSVSYATLQPGSYTFMVRAINSEGIVSRSPATLTFTILPPFWQRWWFYSLVVCLLAAALFSLYRYRINKLLEMERLRVRIASDLHDDVGSSLTRIAVHSEVIQSTSNPARVAASSKEIGAMSREIVSTLSDIVWSIDARHDTLGDLMDRIRSFSLDVLSASDVQVTIESSGLLLSRTIPVDVRQNIYLIVKEAVNNAAKHSAATKVEMKLTQDRDVLTIFISDNGTGLPPEPRDSGHGLANMKMRAERIGGNITFENNHGLEISCRVKL